MSKWRSIMQKNPTECYICGRNGNGDRLEKHHVLGGSNRDFSEADGLYVMLCGERCHRNGKIAAHRCRATSDYLAEEAQSAYEHCIGSHEEFMARYGRNYL